MIRDFLLNVLDAYRAPRRSARWILERMPSMPDCLLMVVLAFAIQSLFGLLVARIPGGEGASPADGGLSMRLTELVLQLVLYAALTAGAYAIGRRFGGQAGPDQIAAVVAWHYLVTAFLAPLNLLGARAMTEEGTVSPLFLLIPLSVGISIWIFASFVAEAHGFRKLGGVVAASVAGFIALGIFTMVLASAFTGAPPPP
ncbi:MAG: YIP1 family protein [Pseudomonadota bacterium]